MHCHLRWDFFRPTFPRPTFDVDYEFRCWSTRLGGLFQILGGRGSNFWFLSKKTFKMQLGCLEVISLYDKHKNKLSACRSENIVLRGASTYSGGHALKCLKLNSKPYESSTYVESRQMYRNLNTSFFVIITTFINIRKCIHKIDKIKCIPPHV